jgi:hypothetical protein
MDEVKVDEKTRARLRIDTIDPWAAAAARP